MHDVSHVPAFTPGQRRRSLAAVITAAGITGLLVGYSMPALALILERQGHSSTEIGINGAAPALATILLGPLVPKLMERLGVLNAMLGSLLVSAGLILLLPLLPGLVPWFIIRFLIGFSGTVQWIGSETWIVAMASARWRGRAIALYMMALSGGFALGPILIGYVGTEGWPPFLAAAGILLLCFPVLWLARGAVPVLPKAPPAAFRQTFRIAPLVLMAAMLAGFTDQGAFTHFAIFATRAGVPQSEALFLLSIMLLANFMLQLPFGWLAAHVDKRRLLILCGCIFFAAPLLMTRLILDPIWLWPVLVLWGGASLGIYTVALTLLGDRFPAASLASANAAIVAVYQFGSILGPPAGGFGMDLMGNDGLMYILAAAAGLFLLFGAYRSFIVRPRLARQGQPQGE